MKKLVITLIIILARGPINAQPQLDSIQVDRIVKTCKLWGHLKYFHPFLADNYINWETAFTDNIMGIIESKNKVEFKNAIQEMLLNLNDPITRVIESYEKVDHSDSLHYPIISYLEDSILLMSIQNYRDLEDINHSFSQFNSLKEKIPSSTGIIFDLRNESIISDDIKGYINSYFPFIESYLSDQVLTIPGYKARFHDGFVPEIGSTSGGYSSGYYVKDAKQILPDNATNSNKVVFIVNSTSELPRIAFALQRSGQGFILSIDEMSDAALVKTSVYEMEDDINVQVRLNELDSEYEVQADYQLSDEMSDQEIYEIASGFINGIKQSKIEWTKKTVNSDKPETSLIDDTFYPNLENRLLAAAKIWTVIEYFFAYKELMDYDWNQVLETFVPRFVSASNSLEYHLAVAEMYKHIQDGHGFVRSNILSNYMGTASPPIRIRYIEGLPVVVDIFSDSVHSVKKIEIGDIITKVDGEPIESVLSRKAKYLSASNEAALLNYVSWSLLKGDDSTVVKIEFKNRKNATKSVELPRFNQYTQIWRGMGSGRIHDPIIKLIDNNIGYADLDRLSSEMVDEMFENFASTKAIVLDMRGYPNGTAWAIAPHLTNKKTVYAASFRRYSPMSMKMGNEYTENLTIFKQSIPLPKQPFYKGLTVMLIDERTQSQAEHTGLFFEAANQTKFIGSQSAGANGDVTNFQIPGNITLYFSGHDIRHIDGGQLQKTGLVPEIEVHPTIEGIRNGIDEVLEKAIDYVNNQIGE